MRTPICDRLEIEFPIFAFSHCRDVVAAVTNAGGFGVLGALAFEPERLQVELDWIEAHVDDRPYGVDFAMPAKYVGQGGGDAASPEMLTAAIPDEYRTFVNQLLDDADIPPVPEGLDRGPTKATGLNVDAEGPGQVEVALGHEGVRMIVNALGPPPPYVVERAHESDILVGALVGAPQHAERQLNIGVDVVIAQGTEAGGHCGEISSMVLVPQIVDTVGDRAHVLAAGGIADGRQMAAAMALGAEGVWCGSVWLLTNEADMYPEVTENLIAATSRDAVRSRAMTGKPARQLRTRWTDAWEQPDAPQPLPMPLQGILYAEAASRFSRVHSREFAGHPAGQIVGSLDRVRPSRQVVTDMVEQWIDAVERLRTMLDDSQ